METPEQKESGEAFEPGTDPSSGASRLAVAYGLQPVDDEQSGPSDSTNSKANSSTSSSIASTVAGPHTNEAGAPTVRSSPPNIHLLNSEVPADGRRGVRLPVHKGTGPRSVAGKQRSSRNAVKHGIFSVPILHGEEDAKLYRLLLKSLDGSLRPQGILESLLVEKLATIVWRHRRLLQAESAAILKKIELVAEERDSREERRLSFEAELDEEGALKDKEGLICKTDECSDTAEYCLDLLCGVRLQLTHSGFHPEDEWIPLGRVYGARYQGRPGKDLLDFYHECANAWQASEEERRSKGFESKQQCLGKFMAELEKEIHKLEGLRKSNAKQRSSRKPKPPDRELLECKVPNAPDMDRLLRYEASLERSFDRTLSQLERLQRMRLGQPVLPPIDVNVSAS